MSIGNKLGRAIGAAGALCVEGTVRGANGLGRFGTDVVAGAEAGYDEKRAQLLITRAAADEKRKVALAALKAAHELALLTAEPAEALQQQRAKALKVKTA